MDYKLRDYYLNSQVKNAAPGQLLIMLYDCLIDQAERAEVAIASCETSQDLSVASDFVSRCIVFTSPLGGSIQREDP